MSSSSSSSSAGAEETWDDWTEAPAPVPCLFSAQIFPTPELALQHDKDVAGVDVALLASTLGKLRPGRGQSGTDTVLRE